MTIEIERIRSEPHVEIGSIIARDTAEIIDTWCARAKDEQPTAVRLHHAALRNQLPGFLQSIAHALVQGGQGNPEPHREHAIEHGEQRWESGWSLTELVRDYQILQVVLLDHLASVLERPLGYREAMAVGVFIDDAIAASIASYVANRDEYVREMERAGIATLHEAQSRKDAFMALVVHELRNPVAPIMNAAEVLSILLRDGEPTARDAVRLIGRQSRALARLLDDLSDLTRMAQGRLTLHHTDVNLVNVVIHAVQTCEPLMTERQHHLVTKTEDGPLVVEGDPDRLVQVVVNLLNNAAKYTPPGGEVSIEARRRDDRVEVAVRDTGVGIPEDMLTRVFDMYTRVDADRTSSPDGLGIGLALVKEIVALHGGSVEAFSAGVGKGAEFVVSLPARRKLEP